VEISSLVQYKSINNLSDYYSWALVLLGVAFGPIPVNFKIATVFDKDLTVAFSIFVALYSKLPF